MGFHTDVRVAGVNPAFTCQRTGSLNHSKINVGEHGRFFPSEHKPVAMIDCHSKIMSLLPDALYLYSQP